MSTLTQRVGSGRRNQPPNSIHLQDLPWTGERVRTRIHREQAVGPGETHKRGPLPRRSCARGFKGNQRPSSLRIHPNGACAGQAGGMRISLLHLPPPSSLSSLPLSLPSPPFLSASPSVPVGLFIISTASRFLSISLPVRGLCSALLSPQPCRA